MKPPQRFNQLFDQRENETNVLDFWYIVKQIGLKKNKTKQNGGWLGFLPMIADSTESENSH